MTQKEFEGKLIRNGIEAVKICLVEHHDIISAIAILHLCKYIGGDDFEARLVLDGEEAREDETHHGKQPEVQ